MPKNHFKKTIEYFSKKLNASAPQEDIDKGEVEIVIDNLNIVLKNEKGIRMHIVLGLLLQPIAEERLKELASSNFLGINTGGCKFGFDETGVSVCLHTDLCSQTTPPESWEWLHRIISVAREWNKVLSLWEEFVPLATSKGEKYSE